MAHNLGAGQVRQKELAEYSRKGFPNKYVIDEGQIPTALPILFDAARVVSKRLRLFKTFWDRVNAEQNIPTKYIIDENGTVVFKYQSQTTFDRLDMEYLEKILKQITDR